MTLLKDRRSFHSGELEAIQYTGDNIEDVIEFTGKHENFDKYFNSIEDYKSFIAKDNHRFKIIHNDRRDEYAVPGDWVVRTIDYQNRVYKRDYVEQNFDII